MSERMPDHKPAIVNPDPAEVLFTITFAAGGDVQTINSGGGLPILQVLVDTWDAAGNIVLEPCVITASGTIEPKDEPCGVKLELDGTLAWANPPENDPPLTEPYTATMSGQPAVLTFDTATIAQRLPNIAFLSFEGTVTVIAEKALPGEKTPWRMSQAVIFYVRYGSV